MNSLVKIIANEDGDVIDDPKWCLVWDSGGSNTQFCTLQVFGYGEGDAEFETKAAKRGITCPDCLMRIRRIKAVKL